MTFSEIPARTRKARELYGDYWLNSPPVILSDLKGRVVLIEFWDYTCIHCKRTLPYLKEWARKYEPYGLVVVGVHTPKFPFGKDADGVQAAVQRSEITFPVVMDNEARIADGFGNRYWPSTYVIDKEGYIRFESTGEGNYQSVEHEIQTLLYESGVSEELPLLMEPLRGEDRPGAVCYRSSPELFAGYLRGSIGNVEGYSPESIVNYVDPRLYLEGRFYVSGTWLNDRNSLRFVGSEAGIGSVFLQYRALEVNVVLKGKDHGVSEIEVMQDAAYLTEENRGDDIVILGGGKSIIRVDEPGMYALVKNSEYGEHTLQLTTGNDGLALYSFAFVTGVMTELVSNN